MSAYNIQKHLVLNNQTISPTMNCVLFVFGHVSILRWTYLWYQYLLYETESNQNTFFVHEPFTGISKMESYVAARGKYRHLQLRPYQSISLT